MKTTLYTGRMQDASPETLKVEVRTTQNPANKINRKTKHLMAYAGAFIFTLFSLATTIVSGQTPINSTLDCTRPVIATTTCVDGYYANGWTTGDNYWTYTLNTSGFSDIEMDFPTRSSGTGPKEIEISYKTSPTASEVVIGTYTVSTSSCGSVSLSLPAACNDKASLSIIVRPKNASATGGTHRMPINGVFTGESAGCSASPVAGTVTSDVDAVCEEGDIVLTLEGAASGEGIVYQWQWSPDGSPSSWTDITDANEVIYNTYINENTYYRVKTTCTTSSLSTESPARLITVNTPPAVSPITGVPSGVLIVGDIINLSNSTPGGTWESLNPSVATVNPLTGEINAVSGGITTIRYNVEGVASCDGYDEVEIHVIWNNTLALYYGVGGVSTTVIAAENVSVSDLENFNFLELDPPSTTCSRGGLSGLNIDTLVIAYDPHEGPYVSYTITPSSGFSANITRVQARTRESDSGATLARIAYRIDGGEWISEERDVTQNTGGSCGANSTTWDFTKDGNNITVNGITGTLEVAVFPYKPSTQYGTFQLNSLEVYGSVTSSLPCTGLPSEGSVYPEEVSICDSGNRWLNLTDGAAGVGISYQWQVSDDGSNWEDLDADDTNATYNVIAGPITSTQTRYYRVATECEAGGISHSQPALVHLVSGGDAGTISHSGSGDYLKVGTPVTFTATPGHADGYWRSNDTSVLSIDSATGVATPHIPGDAVISYIVPTHGCTARATETVEVVYQNTIAAYIGKNGRSVDVNTTSAPYFTVGDLVTDLDTATRCRNGGLSGLINDGVSSFSPSNGHVKFTMNVSGLGTGNNVDIDGFHITARRSNSGLRKVTLGYIINGELLETDGEVHEVLADDCGYSSEVISFLPTSLNPLPTVKDGDVVEFFIYPYDGAAFGGTFQVNAINITAANAPAPSILMSAVSEGFSGESAADVNIYPNPVSHVLNISAREVVNVRIMSMDGRSLIESKHADQVDVSSLVNGMYIIQVYKASDNSLIKTAKFNKL